MNRGSRFVYFFLAVLAILLTIGATYADEGACAGPAGAALLDGAGQNVVSSRAPARAGAASAAPRLV